MDLSIPDITATLEGFFSELSHNGLLEYVRAENAPGSVEGRSVELLRDFRLSI